MVVSGGAFDDLFVLWTSSQQASKTNQPNRSLPPHPTQTQTQPKPGQLRVPRVVGMLGAGLLLANIPGHVVAAFPRRWGVQMRAAALATIFLRCGLELEFKVCGVGGGWGWLLGLWLGLVAPLWTPTALCGKR
jgi:hypothetical protein